MKQTVTIPPFFLFLLVLLAAWCVSVPQASAQAFDQAWLVAQQVGTPAFNLVVNDLAVDAAGNSWGLLPLQATLTGQLRQSVRWAM
jgi:hypothetical protein